MKKRLLTLSSAAFLYGHLFRLGIPSSRRSLLMVSVETRYRRQISCIGNRSMALSTRVRRGGVVRTKGAIPSSVRLRAIVSAFAPQRFARPLSESFPKSALRALVQSMCCFGVSARIPSSTRFRQTAGAEIPSRLATFMSDSFPSKAICGFVQRNAWGDFLTKASPWAEIPRSWRLRLTQGVGRPKRSAITQSKSVPSRFSIWRVHWIDGRRRRNAGIWRRRRSSLTELGCMPIRRAKTTSGIVPSSLRPAFDQG